MKKTDKGLNFKNIKNLKLAIRLLINQQPKKTTRKKKYFRFLKGNTREVAKTGVAGGIGTGIGYQVGKGILSESLERRKKRRRRVKKRRGDEFNLDFFSSIRQWVRKKHEEIERQQYEHDRHKHKQYVREGFRKKGLRSNRMFETRSKKLGFKLWKKAGEDYHKKMVKRNRRR